MLIHNKNSYAIQTEMVECDYYKFINGDIAAVNSYNGRYMEQYSWAEMTLAQLEARR